MSRVRALLLVLPWIAGCGYSFGHLYEHPAVRVRVFDNVDERRTHEFDLTQAVIRELQADGIRVNAHDAPVELVCTIEQIQQPSAVEGQGDVVIVGSFSFRLKAELKDIATGKEIRHGERVEQATFSTARAESQETARQQVFDKLARWVATTLEASW